MIRRTLRRLTARVRTMWFRAKPDDRAFIRVDYEQAVREEPGEDDYRRHEADFARGLPHAELLDELVSDRRNASTESMASAGHVLSAQVSPESADHLVSLAFRSLLRRDADAQTYADYREGFERGTTFLDLINDVTQSQEFKILDERIAHLLAASHHSPTTFPEHPIASDMGAALTLLETRLGDKGCVLQLGSVSGAIDGAFAQKRMRSLLVTLSLMDRL